MRPTEFRLRRAGDVAVVTIDNDEDHTRPTTLGRHALESLGRVLDELERGEFAAAVVTGKPFVFCVGADVDEFPNITPERAREGSRAGHELFGRLRSLPYPTVAAINGACLGGGLEVALHCSHRTISSAVRHFGAPEVFLGLFPAWGATQLVPRLVGFENAVKVIVENPLRQNRMLDAQKAFAMGLADRLLEPVEFVDESIAFARELAETRRAVTSPKDMAVDAAETGPGDSPRDLADAQEIVRRARLRVEDVVHGASPAPYVALDLIEGAATWSLEEGYRREEDAIAELLPSRHAQASIYAFNLVERRAKRATGVPEVPPRRVQKVGIVGAGLMASQLAALFLRRLEVPIVLRDIDADKIGEALDSIRGLHGASTDAIARRAGISQPYLFRLFGSKKQLFLAVNDACFQLTLETFRAAAAGKSGEEALSAIGDAYRGLIQSDRTMLQGQLQAYAASVEDEEIRESSASGYGRLVDYVETVSGADRQTIASFFATGMLLNVLVALDYNIGEDPRKSWMARLAEGCDE